jgi:hypothetical protein
MTTSALDAYLRLLRRPFDAVAGLLPGQRTGPGAAAKRTVDRFDASLRALAGAAIADPALNRPDAPGKAITQEGEPPPRVTRPDQP